MNGQRLKHDPYPVCLGVTLDRYLSYREHLSGCHVVQRSYRAGTTWSRNLLVLHRVQAHISFGYATQSQNTAVCCPVWTRSRYKSHRRQTSLHLISGCLQPTQLSWLPVLSNVAPASLRCKAATNWQPASDHRSPFKLACASAVNHTTRYCYRP